MILSIVVATGKNGEIGKDNRLLWHLPADMKYFKNLTTGHPIIMGRHTYESIGRPLPNRRNIVITRQKDLQIIGVEVVNSLEEAMALVKDAPEIMVIGGADVYKQALPLAQRIYITRVDTTLEADRFFPDLDIHDWNIQVNIDHPADEKNIHAMTFQLLERKN
jgi:dihydrofolate reductase